MFITMNSVVIVAISLSTIMIAYGVIINIEAIVHKKNMNPRAMFIIMAILTISVIVLICNIDYNKSIPAEVYTEEDLDGSYQVGYEAGLKDATVNYNNIEEWFSSINSVTVNTGTEDTIHIIDGNGEEWVLVSNN